jgi:hypothetical protein
MQGDGGSLFGGGVDGGFDEGLGSVMKGSDRSSRVSGARGTCAALPWQGSASGASARRCASCGVWQTLADASDTRKTLRHSHARGRAEGGGAVQPWGAIIDPATDGLCILLGKGAGGGWEIQPPRRARCRDAKYSVAVFKLRWGAIRCLASIDTGGIRSLRRAQRRRSGDGSEGSMLGQRIVRPLGDPFSLRGCSPTCCVVPRFAHADS